jgi:FkbM family methyltransferase
MPEFKIRPGTTDEKVVEEVIKRNCYEHKKLGFFLKDCPVWLDLGGNIGTFCCKASEHGCKVISYEPEEENFQILNDNVRANASNVVTVKSGVVAGPTGELELYLCKGDYNKYRHTIFKKRGRQSVTIQVKNFKEALAEHKPNGVKIDIEGAEIDILDSMEPGDWPDHVTHLVFEYSFDIDSSTARFKRIVDKLREAFATVHHRKVNFEEEHFKHWPAAVIVYAKK